MEQEKINQLLKLLGTALTNFDESTDDLSVIFALKEWMNEHAPEYWKFEE
jgi:hypothetical protein